MSSFVAEVMAGDHAMVGAALQRDPALAHARHEDGRSVLRIALDAQDDTLVTQLLDHGAEPDASDCVLLGDIERLKWMIEADPSTISKQDGRGLSCLHVAAAQGRAGILTWLTRHGCDLTDRTGDGSAATALHLAAGLGQTSCAQILCGAEPSLARIADQEGRTALHAAAEHGHGDLASLLLSFGARADVADRMGFTPRDLAERSGHPALANALDPMDSRPTAGRPAR